MKTPGSVVAGVDFGDAELARAVRERGGLIVEDCAQAFDGTLRLPEGIDIALYSFGPIKVATALGGA
mgnify:CR=1 FL=1